MTNLSTKLHLLDPFAGHCGFLVNGLTGYRVIDTRHGYELLVTGIVSYSWNELTNKHDIPDRREGWSLSIHRTAKAAVARAHQHAEWIKREQAKTAA